MVYSFLRFEVIYGKKTLRDRMCPGRINACQVEILADDWVVGCGEGVVYLTSPGRPTDIDLQLGNACYPYSR